MITNKYEVIIVSYGGVATTTFIDFVGKFKRCNDPEDKDQLKHLSAPPLFFGKQLKVIYVFGDPSIAACSLFRRNYAFSQALKLQKGFSTPKYESLMSIESFLSAEKDVLGFSSHFFRWLNSKTNYPVLFIDVETLFDRPDILINFIDLPPAAYEDYPVKKNRKSYLDESIRNRMNNSVFEDLLVCQNNINLYHIKHKEKCYCNISTFYTLYLITRHFIGCFIYRNIPSLFYRINRIRK